MNLNNWFTELRTEYNVANKDFLRDDCTGVNDMLNPNLIYAIKGMFLKGTWNMNTNEGMIYSGNGMNGFSKTKGKRKMVGFKI